MSNILQAEVIKRPDGGHCVKLTHGADFPGYGAYEATAPELDRLIAELGKARDACRAANRPVHSLKQLY